MVHSQLGVFKNVALIMNKQDGHCKLLTFSFAAPPVLCAELVLGQNSFAPSREVREERYRDDTSLRASTRSLILSC